MASDLMWGNLMFMTPSNLCFRYLHYEHVVPERSIEVGARYRARKSLNEHVRGYKLIKRSLKRQLEEIEHDRKCAHYQLPVRHEVLQENLNNAKHLNDFKRPTKFFFTPSYTMKSPLFKPHIEIGTWEPRMEHVLGLLDIRKRLMKNPSEKIKADPGYSQPTAQEILGIKDQSHEELRRQKLGLRKIKAYDY